MDEQQARQAFELALKTQRPAFEDFFLARLLGLRFEYPGHACVISFELRDFMLNPQGSLHGGVVATVMDISMGHLLNRLQGPGTTLEMKIQYVKAARQGTLWCRGELTKLGQGISYLRSTLSDEAGDIVAFATSTWKRLK
ncbi:PaaI family thioesterase [Candidimonas nitroreducens]|uniref:Thioesterase n=1 Tax=Candidimonas nitroreducens TaxID=683354 RepID=A0A225MK20_9BURK|nr:PaaI family thioesterase [Candidimonas nitroreducens]OWT61737.1 thioesterase [Candidimonas nitroreducens]